MTSFSLRLCVGSVLPFPENGSTLAKRVAPGSLWTASLGMVEGIAALVWPVETRGVGCYFPCTGPEAQARYEIVLDLDEWRAMEVKWHTPFTQVTDMGALVEDVARNSTMRASQGSELPFLEVAAKHCFWQTNCSKLVKLCQHRKLAVAKTASLYTVLTTLIVAILGPISDEDLLSILLLRVTTNKVHEELIAMDDTLEHIDKYDHKELT